MLNHTDWREDRLDWAGRRLYIRAGDTVAVADHFEQVLHGQGGRSHSDRVRLVSCRIVARDGRRSRVTSDRETDRVGDQDIPTAAERIDLIRIGRSDRIRGACNRAVAVDRDQTHVVVLTKLENIGVIGAAGQ